MSARADPDWVGGNETQARKFQKVFAGDRQKFGSGIDKMLCLCVLDGHVAVGGHWRGIVLQLPSKLYYCLESEDGIASFRLN